MKRKEILTRTAGSNDQTGETKTEEKWTEVKIPPDISQYNIPDISSLATLDDGTSDDGPWYILYWMDQYHTLHPAIKEQMKNSGEPLPEYYRDFSESIGAMLNIEFAKDITTVPVSDIVSTISANTYTRVLDYIITQHSADLHEEMSIKTNNVFRKNMTFIKDDSGIASKISTDPHGRNLVTDSQHYLRLSSGLVELEELLKTKLGKMYRVLKFIQSNVSEMAFFKWKAKILVEKTFYDIDLNQNKIDTVFQATSGTEPPVNTRLKTADLPVT